MRIGSSTRSGAATPPAGRGATGAACDGRSSAETAGRHLVHEPQELVDPVARHGRGTLVAVRGERVLRRVRPVADGLLLDHARRALQRVGEPQQARDHRPVRGGPLELEEPAREPVEQLARLDAEVLVAVLGHRAQAASRVWTSRARSRDIVASSRRGLERLAGARLRLARRLRHVGDRLVHLLDRGGLLLRRELDLARGVGGHPDEPRDLRERGGEHP